MDLRELLFDSETEVGSGSEDALVKSLAIGYGTDAAGFTGGRALQPEDCDTTLFNVMREDVSDFKMMNTIKKSPAKSTVTQFNLRTDVGDEDLGFVEEGGIAPENNQEIVRKTRDMKYIQKFGEVTEQAIQANTFEPAFEAEKIATTISTLRTAEKYCFHGDAKVVPKQFDGFLAQIRDAPSDKRNIYDLRGKTIGTAGEAIFTQVAEMIANKGGEANKVFFPLILGEDIQALCRDRLRFGTKDNQMTTVWDEYPTIFGTLKIGGDTAGVDKMFKPKGLVKPSGKTPPNIPSALTAVAASGAGSLFLAGDAGNYTYTVHAVNEYGISEGKTIAAVVAVAAGDKVTITITPATTNPGTGFIICRSAKGGSIVMEMVRIGRSDAATTVFVDLNEDLPGTAEMLFLTEKKMQVVAEFLQFLPLRLYRMAVTNRLVVPFIMALWGTPNLKAPHWSGYVKNIDYRGGLHA